MRVTDGMSEVSESSAGSPERSLAASARRAQIVEAAIETLAECGHGQTTFARIRQRAGISSTRLISYHFGTKGELMDAVLEEVGLRAHQAISQRVAGESSASGALTARIEAQVEWVAHNSSAVRAMSEICRNERDAEGVLRYGVEVTARANVEGLEPILRAGQESGEFRQFDTGLMALTLKSAIDAAIVRMARPPRLTLAQCVHELTTLAHLATRKES
ncbi:MULTISPECIES: TetR family transcriptional regulator [unclassified Streptomyces]|uniref:TetR/AcrR family transcriptional regulator n=1 Tax=unclassified Streptomyces TaxID=2593676 RepID=UPI0003A0DD02|nr:MULTISPECIES: TetR family transcriptional regulator [unclassified Streptomyces]MYT33912.1 TetR family transcriptional regulator [Streptomyces sp. SID8354]